ILLTVLLLVACGDNNGNASNGDEPDNNSSENNTKDNSNNNDDNESDELVTINMMLNLHTPEVPNDTIPDALEERLNVRLDIDWVPDNNYLERLNTAFATGTLPEVFGVGFNQLDQFR